jgi:hypothetical protein
MKTKMKRQGSTELPRFAVGALAFAGASAADAATVQITFTGSYISTTGGSPLVTDFGGDGVADIGYLLRPGFPTSGAKLFVPSQGPLGQLLGLASGISLVGPTSTFVVIDVAVGSSADWAFGAGASTSKRGLAAVVFSDANIRNGAHTNGWLDITAVANHPGEKRLTVHRLIFDDASTTAPTGLTSASTGIAEWSAVPEPSSLGLLALGAGGLLARRRRAA